MLNRKKMGLVFFGLVMGLSQACSQQSPSESSLNSTSDTYDFARIQSLETSDGRVLQLPPDTEKYGESTLALEIFFKPGMRYSIKDDPRFFEDDFLHLDVYMCDGELLLDIDNFGDIEDFATNAAMIDDRLQGLLATLNTKYRTYCKSVSEIKEMLSGSLAAANTINLPTVRLKMQAASSTEIADAVVQPRQTDFTINHFIPNIQDSLAYDWRIPTRSEVLERAFLHPATGEADVNWDVSGRSYSLLYYFNNSSGEQVSDIAIEKARLCKQEKCPNQSHESRTTGRYFIATCRANLWNLAYNVDEELQSRNPTRLCQEILIPTITGISNIMTPGKIWKLDFNDGKFEPIDEWLKILAGELKASLGGSIYQELKGSASDW